MERNSAVALAHHAVETSVSGQAALAARTAMATILPVARAAHAVGMCVLPQAASAA